jgi:7-carboxy-7-deazaguanine synthase
MRCPGWPCDTPQAIFPDQWRHEYEEVSPEKIIERLRVHGTSHVCITGGEPLLQNRKEMSRLISYLRHEGVTIDVFTNGSRPLGPVTIPGITVIMDWKCPGSGEEPSYMGERTFNLQLLTHRDAVKFVVMDRTDLEYMQTWLLDHPDRVYRTYVSPAYGRIEPAEIVDYMMTHHLHETLLNVQVHKYIWDPNQRYT